MSSLENLHLPLLFLPPSIHRCPRSTDRPDPSRHGSWILSAAPPPTRDLQWEGQRSKPKVVCMRACTQMEARILEYDRRAGTLDGWMYVCTYVCSHVRAFPAQPKAMSRAADTARRLDGVAIAACRMPMSNRASVFWMSPSMLFCVLLLLLLLLLFSSSAGSQVYSG